MVSNSGTLFTNKTRKKYLKISIIFTFLKHTRRGWKAGILKPQGDFRWMTERKPHSCLASVLCFRRCCPVRRAVN